jgi:hypothetical protein
LGYPRQIAICDRGGQVRTFLSTPVLRLEYEFLKRLLGENMTVALKYDIFMSKAQYSKNKLIDYKWIEQQELRICLERSSLLFMKRRK